MKLIITRPTIDAVPLAAKLFVLGHSVTIAPVLDIVPRDGVVIPNLNYQAICITSANGMRCLGAELDQAIPIYAVGEQSAAAATARGFKHVDAEGGDVDGLVRHITAKLKPGDGPLLYLSGAETSGDLQGQLTKLGFTVARVIIYDARARSLHQHSASVLSSDGVLLFSQRSAKLWVAGIEALGMGAAASRLIHYCLSQNVAQKIPPSWVKRIANLPTQSSLLGLLENATEEE